MWEWERSALEWFTIGLLLSSIPSFTSDPFLIPPIFLISYLITFWLLIPSLILLSLVLFLFTPDLPFRPTLHALDLWLSNTLCSGIIGQLIPICLIVLLLFSVSVLNKLWSLLPEPPVYKPCISLNTRQSDYFVFSSSIALLHLPSSYFVCCFSFCFVSLCCVAFRCISCSNYPLNLYSDLCLTSVWPLSNSGLRRPSWNCRKYCILYEWAQHISWSQVLFCYPLPISDNPILIRTPTLFQPHSGIGW